MMYYVLPDQTLRPAGGSNVATVCSARGQCSSSSNCYLWYNIIIGITAAKEILNRDKSLKRRQRAPLLHMRSSSTNLVQSCPSSNECTI